MNLQETKAKLEKYNQSQLLKYYDELDENQRQSLLKQIDEIDEIGLNVLKNLKS